jgi:cobalt ECF transporter T component CbiQ
MGERIPGFLLAKTNPVPHGAARPRRGSSFINKAVEHVAEVMRSGMINWELSSRDGLFQRLDARVKILFLAFFVIIVSLKKTIFAELTIGLVVLLLTIASRLNPVSLYRRVFLLSFIFGFLIALPSACNVFVQGTIIFPLFDLPRSYNVWIYHVPSRIGITEEGLRSLVMLTLRVMNSLALSFLVFSTTPFPEIVRALKVFRIPDAFLMTITLSYKYIFIFARTVHDMHLAKKGRLLGAERDSEARKWIADRMAVMFAKSRHRCEEVYKAMVQRGFTGTITIQGYRNMTSRDWLTGAALLISGVLFLLL